MNMLTAILNWIKGPGLRPIIIIIVGIIVYHLFKSLAARGIKILIIKQERRKGKTKKEQELRAKTLSRVVASLTSIAIGAIIIFTLLQSLGINISALLAGAGVVGLAVGFGAQSLIKDYLNGIFILAEDQFVIGDVIKIGDTAGTVEEFNLRRTVLRDVEGIAHIIPNSQIRMVSNLTLKWSGVIVDVNVSYKENLEKAINLLNRVGKEMAQEERIKKYIIEAPKVLGVDELGRWGVKIKMISRTTPIKQWLVKRELIKRIKEAFDKEGIEIAHR